MIMRPTPTRAETGFTLIEVLIALVISAIGLLGIAGMQMFSINNTSASNVRAVAAIEASNLISQMKATPNYWHAAPDAFAIKLTTDDGAVTISDVDGTADDSGATLDGQTADCTVDDACDSEEKAVAYSLREWKKRVDQRLPNAEVTIRRIKPAASPRFPIFSIDIAWREKVSAQNLHMRGSYYNNSGDTLASNVRTLNYRIAVQP